MATVQSFGPRRLHGTNAGPTPHASRRRRSKLRRVGIRRPVPPRVTPLSVTGQVTGLYRSYDATLARYELYRGVDASPNLAGAPFETFTSLPHTTAALAAGHVYHFVLRQRNKYGLISLNALETTFDIGGGGTINPTPPRDPSPISATPAAAGTVLVSAEYHYGLDGANAGDSFLVYLRSNGTNPDPAIDTPTVVAMAKADGVAKLVYSAGPFAEGTTVKVIVRTRRTGTPNVDSTGSTVYTAIATLLGPAAPTPSDAFVGTTARQQQ